MTGVPFLTYTTTPVPSKSSLICSLPLVKPLFVCLMLFAPLITMAQEVDEVKSPPFVINAGGGLIISGEKSVTYSIGNYLTINSHSFNATPIDLEIYPNPVRQYLQIASPVDIVRLKILSSQGILIREKSLTNHQINLSFLASGPYILLFYSPDGRQIATRQIIKY